MLNQTRSTAGGGRQGAAPGTVFVVDDDEAVRDSLRLLFRSVGLEVETFATAPEFLAAYEVGRAGCLILDVRLPGMSGLELQQELESRGSTLPIVFITGHGDVPMAVRAIRSGAVDFLEKPFREQTLLDLVNQALERQRLDRRDRRRRSELHGRLRSLTPRERQVVDLVVEGEANKVIASRLGVSQRTVEIHRAHAMRKMGAGSLAELVTMVLRARGEAPSPAGR